MQGTSTRAHLVGVRPLRLSALMELYERNFRLLEQLLPELDPPFDTARSQVRDEPDLFLEVTERGSYTAALRLTYELEGDREPDLWVRVYRDARVAEATRARRPLWLAVDEDDPEALRFLSAQWERNLVLHKWLTYLLERGHGFEMADRPRLGDYST